MVYERLYADFKNRIPQCKEYLEEKERKYSLDETDGIHVLFGSAVAPYVMEVMQKGDKETLRNIADFMENMENDPDIRVIEVDEQSIMEHLLGTDKKLVEKYADIWGKSTRTAFRAVGQYIE